MKKLLTLVISVSLLFISPYLGGAIANAQKITKPRVITNSIGMRLIKIPGGTFMMGTKCPKDDPFTKKNEAKDATGGYVNGAIWENLQELRT